MNRIIFDQLPASIRKPGKYAEFNLKLATRTLPTNAQNTLLIGAMAQGAATPYTPYWVFDGDSALSLFGESPAYDMAIAAMTANPYIRLQVMGIPADGDYTTALASVFGGDYQVFAIASNTQADLTILRDHLDAVSHPLEQRGAIAASAFIGSVATGSALTAALNAGRITMAWLKNAPNEVHKIAAAYAGVIASEEDPARPLNTLWLKGILSNAITDRAGRMEQEVALAHGLSPLEVGAGDKVQIVRAISTYTKNAAGTDDISLLDITTIRTLDYVRKACIDRISLRFPRDKKTKRVAAAVRGELLDVLYKCEELEIVEEVEANKAQLLVQDNLQDPNRLDSVIPTDVVNGLHVFAARIDLYL